VQDGDLLLRKLDIWVPPVSSFKSASGRGCHCVSRSRVFHADLSLSFIASLSLFLLFFISLFICFIFLSLPRFFSFLRFPIGDQGDNTNRTTSFDLGWANGIGPADLVHPDFENRGREVSQLLPCLCEWMIDSA
jgi:hypothetical protein